MVKENGDTRGLSQRELLLEVRNDIKEIKQGQGKRPTRTELYGTIGAVVAVIIGINTLL